jgi:hypothetical protein
MGLARESLTMVVLAWRVRVFTANIKDIALIIGECSNESAVEGLEIYLDSH